MKVEIRFAVQPGILRASDGYLLFAAMKRFGLVVDADPGLQILGRGSSALFRVPRDRIAGVLSLSGVSLNVDGALIRFGAASVRPILPEPDLSAWLVTIKGKKTEADIMDAAARQLGILEVGSGAMEIGRRAAVRVAGRWIVGYGARIRGLSDADSIIVQSRGLGGRNRFGCGVFVATQRRAAKPAARRPN